MCLSLQRKDQACDAIYNDGQMNAVYRPDSLSQWLKESLTFYDICSLDVSVYIIYVHKHSLAKTIDALYNVIIDSAQHFQVWVEIIRGG